MMSTTKTSNIIEITSFLNLDLWCESDSTVQLYSFIKSLSFSISPNHCNVRNGKDAGQCNLHNCNKGIMVLLKALRKTMHHKDATIFHYVHCVPLSIFNVLTQSFPVLKVTQENEKRYIFDKIIKLQPVQG